MSLTLIRHAIAIILNNLVSALKASIGPLLIGLGLIAAVNVALGLPAEGYQAVPTNGSLFVDPAAMDPALATTVLVSSLWMFAVLIVVFSWVAVTWHRFILLEEYPGPVPSLTGKPIGSYIWASIKLAIILILAAIPILLIVGLPMASLVAISPLAGSLVGTLLVGGVLGYLWLRIALILPAAAIGETLTIGESWSATARVSGAIFGVAILVMVVNLIVNLPSLLIGGGVASLVLSLIGQWFTAMLGVSILTTLYGHLVEGRDLPQ